MSLDSPDQAADAAPIADRHDSGETSQTHGIPLYLDRAWAVARITGIERSILQYVRERSWDPSAHHGDGGRPCPVNATRVAALFGIYRQQASSSLLSLVRDGLLIRYGDGYRIGRDLDSWGEGRLDENGRRYATLGDDFTPPPPRLCLKMRIPSSLRTAVFERDAYRCLKCGGYQGLAADHVVPESRGGPTTLDNLQTLCTRCNNGKGANTIDYRARGTEVADDGR